MSNEIIRNGYAAYYDSSQILCIPVDLAASDLIEVTTMGDSGWRQLRNVVTNEVRDSRANYRAMVGREPAVCSISKLRGCRLLGDDVANEVERLMAQLAAEALYGFGHCWSRFFDATIGMPWPLYQVYCYAMRASCHLSDKYNLGIWQ